MSAEVVVWEEPPAARPGQSEVTSALIRFAAALRSRPGEWGRMPYCFPSRQLAGNTASSVRRGLSAAGTGPFEAVSRTIRDRDTVEYRVYARYVGEAAE